jgi:hypothetical protein
MKLDAAALAIPGIGATVVKKGAKAVKKALGGGAKKINGSGPIPGKDIVLGLKKTLNSTMKKQGGHDYRDWVRSGLSKYDPKDIKQFENAFKEATGNAKNIHFSLDSFNLKTAAKKGKSKPFELEKNVTNWEFMQLIDNSKTIFWQNGKKVEKSKVIERMNK